MTDIQNQITSKAREIALVANTPAYLLRELRKDSTAQILASKVSSTELLRELSLFLDTPSFTRGPLVYVLLLALSQQADLTNFQIALGLAKGRDSWLDEFIALLRGTVTSNSFYETRAPYATISPPSALLKSSSSASLKVMNLKSQDGEKR